MASAEMDWSVFTAFVDEFKGESDRAAVVLGAAKLDMLLYQILDRFLIPVAGSKDELLDGDSPLSTFSSRINMCCRLGLISAEFAKALHLVRKIRNAFAHDLSGCSLDSGPHADRLRSLLLPVVGLPFFKEFRRKFVGVAETPSANFRACLAMMAARLEYRLVSTQTIASDDAFNFVLEGWANPSGTTKKSSTATTSSTT